MSLHRPPVHRSVRTGAILVLVGVLIFIGAMVVAQLYYQGPPAYSLAKNYISDLGNTSSLDGHLVSPAYAVFNVGIILLGILSFVGILLFWGAFPPGAGRIAGLGLLLVAGLAAITVGLFPENVNGTVHGIASLLVFLLGGLGLLVLGATFTARSGWGNYRWFSIVLGAITLVSLVLYLFTNIGGTEYPGLFERLVVAPILLWGIVIPIYLIRMPVRAPRHLVPGV